MSKSPKSESIELSSDQPPVPPPRTSNNRKQVSLTDSLSLQTSINKDTAESELTDTTVASLKEGIDEDSADQEDKELVITKDSESGTSVPVVGSSPSPPPPPTSRPPREVHLEAVTPERTPTPATPCSDGRKMNGLSFSELCCLFCCPPCPGQIAAKLAFLPPEATYTFLPDETNTKFTLSLTEKAEWQYTQRELEGVEVFHTRTSKGNRIGCMFIRGNNPRFTLLFSHGNAVDLGQMSSFYVGLGSRINCNIFSYDYSGYGVSTGTPSEKNLYADIDAAWQALRTRYGISPEHVILYGQSIGTGESNVKKVSAFLQYNILTDHLHEFSRNICICLPISMEKQQCLLLTWHLVMKLEELFFILL